MMQQVCFYVPNTQVVPVEMNSHNTKNENYANGYCQIIPVLRIEPLTKEKKEQNKGKCHNI